VRAVEVELTATRPGGAPVPMLEMLRCIAGDELLIRSQTEVVEWDSKIAVGDVKVRLLAPTSRCHSISVSFVI